MKIPEQFHASEALWKSFFQKTIQYHNQFFLDCVYCVEVLPLQQFHFGEEGGSHRLQKLYHLEGDVRGCVVAMDQLIVIVPRFWSFVV